MFLKRIMSFAMFCFISSFICSSSLLFADDSPCALTLNKEEKPTITISRSAKVVSEPDEGIISLSLMIEEGLIDQAVDKSKARMNSVIESLRSKGVEKKNIKTTNYQITPLYEGKPLFSKSHRPTSYRVSYSLRADIYDLESIGEIISLLSSIAALNVESIEFTSTKIDELKKEAFKKAAAIAHDTALDVVAAAGGKLGQVLKIEESSDEPVVNQRHQKMDNLFAANMVAEQSEVPIEAGTLEIEVSCTVTYEVEKL